MEHFAKKIAQTQTFGQFYTIFLELQFPKHHCRACRNVEFQPLFMILNVERIIVGQVDNAVISKAVTAKLLGIGIKHHLVRARRHEETVVGVRARRREIEHEDKLATHIAEHLIAVVVPNLGNGCCLDVLLALDNFKHLLIEIT